MTKLNVHQIRQLLREHGMKSNGSKKQVMKRARDAGILPEEKQEEKTQRISKSSQRKAKRERLKREREEERARKIEEEAKTVQVENVTPRPESNVTFQQTWKTFGAHTLFHQKFEQKQDEISEQDIAGLRWGHDLLGSCKNGDIPHIVHLVKSTGISTNYTDHMGRAGIHWAAWEGRYEVVDCLAQLGADVDIPDKHGQRPIHFAAQGGYLKVINSLIKYHADINILDGNKNAAIQYAAYWNYHSIVEQLIVYGGSVSDKGKTFSSVRHYGVDNPELQVAIQSGLQRAKHIVRNELMTIRVDVANQRLPEVIVDLLLDLIYLA